MLPQKRNYTALGNFAEEPLLKRRRIDDRNLITSIEMAFANPINFLLVGSLLNQLALSSLSIDVSAVLLTKLSTYMQSAKKTPPPVLLNLANICLTALEDLDAFQDWIEKTSQKDIAIFIYNFSSLANCREQPIARFPPFFPDLPPLLTAHLEIILKKEIFNGKSLSILMKSLGMLAREKKLTGTLSIQMFIPIIKAFKNNDLVEDRCEEGELQEDYEEGELEEKDEKEDVITTIENTFYALGLMTKAELLTDKIDCKILKILLVKSENFQWRSFTVSQCFLMLSALAEYNLLEGSFDTSLLSHLTTKLDDHAPSISNCLLSLGLLANKKLLVGTFDIAIIEALLEKFTGPYHKSILNIGNCATGLEFLITEGKIAGQINTAVFSSLLNHLPSERKESFQKQISSVANKSLPTTSSRVDSSNHGNKTATISNTRAPNPSPRARSVPSAPTQPSFLRRSIPSIRPFSQKIDNPLYKAIEAKDLEKLKTLLNCLNKDLSVTPKKSALKSHTKCAASRHQFFNADDDNDERNNTLITDFFDSIPQDALRELCSKSEASYFSVLLKAASRHTRYQLAIDGKFEPILLGLSINELEHFINSLIPLELYRDFDALEMIIKTLYKRYKENQNEAKEIFDLQQILIKRGLEYHKECNHFKVVDSLQALDKKLTKASICNPKVATAPLPVSSTQGELVPVHIVPPAASLPVQTPVRITNSLRINNNYQYEDTDINTILTARIREFGNVHVLASANMNAGEENNRIEDVLKSFLVQASNDSQHLLLPIHIGGHWIGIRIQLKEKKITKITYYNSLQNPNDDYATTIKNQLWAAGLIEGHLQIHEPSINMQQSDGTSCGPILIENFYCDLKKQWWQKNPLLPTETIQNIRRKHLQILKDTNQEYYGSFNPKQANNISSVRSLTRQRDLHGFYATGSTSSTQGRQDTPEPGNR